MTTRRDLLVGLGCFAAVGTAEILRPRRHVVHMPAGKNLSSIVPHRLGDWQLGGDGDIVQPRTEGTLASKLYSDELARIYHHAADPSRAIMLSVAYGSEQSDSLQLHRPEACYPAVGFTIGERRPTRLDLAGGAAVATVSLEAHSQQRFEDIVYWTRVGDAFPRNNSEQRDARLAAAIHGVIPDGVLVRASALREDRARPQFEMVNAFLLALASDLPADAHAVLLGKA